VALAIGPFTGGTGELSHASRALESAPAGAFGVHTALCVGTAASGAGAQSPSADAPMRPGTPPAWLKENDMQIGEPQRIYEIPEPVTVPDDAPDAQPDAEPARVPEHNEPVPG
jgi:hypothetical protein